MEKIKQIPIVKKLGFNRIVLFAIMILMYIIFCATIPGFFGPGRIMSILNYAYFLGFLALGVTFVIATGGIDFSIGPVMFCCALMAGYTFGTYHIPMVLAMLMSVAIGFLFGLFNGFMVSFIGIPPFIISMASMNIAKGIASVYTKTQSVQWPQSASDGGWFRNIVKVGGFPVGLVVFICVVVILYIILNAIYVGDVSPLIILAIILALITGGFAWVTFRIIYPIVQSDQALKEKLKMASVEVGEITRKLEEIEKDIHTRESQVKRDCLLFFKEDQKRVQF